MTLPEQMPLDEERVVFLHTLGAALAEWAEVEGMLLQMVKSGFGENGSKIVGVGFVSIVGFNSKLKFADEAIVRSLLLHGREDAKEAWTTLAKRLQKQSEMRNELAHFQKGEFPNAVEGRRIALCPWKYSKSWVKDAPTEDCHCVVEIVKARLEFEALRISISNYLARLRGQPEPFPKSREQADSPPTVRQLRLQIHGALGAPHLSSREIQAYESFAAAEASMRFRLEGASDETEIKAGSGHSPAGS